MTKKETYIFSIGNLSKLFINNAEWLVFAFIPFPILLGALSHKIFIEDSIKAAAFFAIVMLPITFLFTRYYKKFSYKIIFDLENNKVTFYMLRNRGTITEKISNIEKIIINYRIAFLVNGEKIKYQEDNIKNELSAFLDEHFDVESGIFRHLPFPFK